MSDEIDKLDLLKLRATSFRDVLKQSTEKVKDSHITIPTADEFNRLLDDLAAAFPAVKDSLPNKITAKSDMRLAGRADVKLLELEIRAEQVVRIIDLLVARR